MLEQLSRHGGYDLEISCVGDLDIDAHHSIEDVGLALGEAFKRALGKKRGSTAMLLCCPWTKPLPK